MLQEQRMCLLLGIQRGGLKLVVDKWRRNSEIRSGPKKRPSQRKTHLPAEGKLKKENLRGLQGQYKG